MARRPLPLWQSLPLWVLIHAAGLAVSLLPRRVELRLGRLLGGVCFPVERKRRAVGEENLRRCLPELSERERQDLLRANYEHYGMLFFELFHLFSPIPGHYRAYALRISTVEGLANWRKAAAHGKGVIFASCHLGNWEMMAAAGALAGIRNTMVTRRLTPEWLHQRLESSRLSVGAHAAYQPRTLPAVMRALRAGDCAGFVIDQYAPPPMGIPIRFFGVKVDTLHAVGPLARRTGAAVVPAVTHRDAHGVVHLRIEPELDLAGDLGDPERVTQILADKVEAWIREHPEQWLWVHRRFKNLPPQ